MIFRHVKLSELNYELESETTEKGRVYKTPEGKLYPSITTVLSDYNKKAIYEWRQNVGEEEANRISRAASGRGTRLHNAVEKYLLNEMNPVKRRAIMPDALPLYIQLEEILKEKIGVIYGIETPLYSDRLKIAGRCDCVAEWNGTLSIVDWKTSKKLKKKEHIQNYFMQGTAYAEMFEERTNRQIEQVVIVIANDHLQPQVFIEKKQDHLADLKNYVDKYYNS